MHSVGGQCVKAADKVMRRLRDAGLLSEELESLQKHTPAHKKLLNCFGYKFYSGTLWLPCSSLALLLPGAASLPQGGITPHLLTLQIHVFNLHSPGRSSYIFGIQWNHVPLQLGSAWKTSPAPAQRCTPLGYGHWCKQAGREMEEDNGLGPRSVLFCSCSSLTGKQNYSSLPHSMHTNRKKQERENAWNSQIRDVSLAAPVLCRDVFWLRDRLLMSLWTDFRFFFFDCIPKSACFPAFPARLSDA